MNVKTGFSMNANIDASLDEACKDFGTDPIELIIFFSDSNFFASYTEKLHMRYPNSTIIGSSTFGSFSSAGFCRGGINVAALTDGIHVHADVIHEITRGITPLYERRIYSALQHLGLDQCNHTNTCCLVFNPAGTSCEELVLDMLMKVMRNVNIPVVGGSASSEICLAGEISLNGVTYANSSIYALVHLDDGKIGITLENVFKPMGKEYRATKADATSRTLYELDGQSASEVLCKDLGITHNQLAQTLAAHPFGRIPKGQLYINEVERVNDDGSITTYCRILNGSKVVLLEIADLEETMKKTWKTFHENNEQPKFSLIVNCYSRTQLYLKNEWMDTFTQEMNKEVGPYIGYTTHGEVLDDFLLNLSLIVITFGDRS